MSNVFLDNFETKRQMLEQRVLGMPEARQILSRFGSSPESVGQRYLHALPTCLALLSIMAQSPRTVDAFQERVERAGQTRVRHQEAAKAFTCFGIAYLYKATVKNTGQPELGVLLSRISTLVLLTPRELERIDLVTRTFSHRGPDGRRDRLAPASLLLWWLSGGESPARAFEADTFLQLFEGYLNKSLEYALEHQIWMEFPW
ncbi:MAG: hypothetical protein WC314_11310 [Vulcanimicrobiota bacterium]